VSTVVVTTAVVSLGITKVESTFVVSVVETSSFAIEPPHDDNVTLLAITIAKITFFIFFVFYLFNK
jgi:hypothetical protein